ncbi:MAG: site-2 protease family protein [Gaiellales bacterium]
MTSEQLFFLIVAGVMLLFGFPVHEFSHAFAADRLGDRTARYLGRLSLDPRRHFDPVGGIVLIITALAGVPIGWAKPTPVNPSNLAYGHRGEALVALAGPTSNLVMAAVAAISVRIVEASPSALQAISTSDIPHFLYSVLVVFVFINVLLFVFNLLPVPPLDGWAVLKGLVSPRTAFQLRQVEQYGIFLLVAVFFVGGRIIFPIADRIFGLLTGHPFFLP